MWILKKKKKVQLNFPKFLLLPARIQTQIISFTIGLTKCLQISITSYSDPDTNYQLYSRPNQFSPALCYFTRYIKLISLFVTRMQHKYFIATCKIKSNKIFIRWPALYIMLRLLKSGFKSYNGHPWSWRGSIFYGFYRNVITFNIICLLLNHAVTHCVDENKI
jgi:hypothetical protein